MYVITKNNKYLNIIKKSKFIGLSFYIEDKNDIKKILENLKEEYKDARHICYAYVLKNQEKQEDDGEPKGTAGIQILDAIKKEELINILIVVVRYFGGILLGASGLIHAYKKTAYEVINISSKKEYTKYIEKDLIVNYKEYNKIIKNKDIEIIKEIFDEYINLKIKYSKDKEDEILSYLEDIIKTSNVS